MPWARMCVCCCPLAWPRTLGPDDGWLDLDQPCLQIHGSHWASYALLLACPRAVPCVGRIPTCLSRSLLPVRVVLFERAPSTTMALSMKGKDTNRRLPSPCSVVRILWYETTQRRFIPKPIVRQAVICWRPTSSGKSPLRSGVGYPWDKPCAHAKPRTMQAQDSLAVCGRRSDRRQLK